MKLIVGLGNPEPKYKWTPHNLGFLVIEAIAEKYQIEVNKRKFRMLLGGGLVGSEKVLLGLPYTYMNLSGAAVASVVRWKRVDLRDLIVICDDVNLELGRIRIKSRGGYGGHMGLGSIIDFLGSESFPRLRIGVGSAERIFLAKRRKTLTDYVLHSFNKEELEVIVPSIERAVEACWVWVTEGIVAAMNKFNPPATTEKHRRKIK